MNGNNKRIEELEQHQMLLAESISDLESLMRDMAKEIEAIKKQFNYREPLIIKEYKEDDKFEPES